MFLSKRRITIQLHLCNLEEWVCIRVMKQSTEPWVLCGSRATTNRLGLWQWECAPCQSCLFAPSSWETPAALFRFSRIQEMPCTPQKSINQGMGTGMLIITRSPSSCHSHLLYKSSSSQNFLLPSLQIASFSAAAISQHFSPWLTYFHITLQIRTDCRHVCIHTPLTFYSRPQLKHHLKKKKPVNSIKIKTSSRFH